MQEGTHQTDALLAHPVGKLTDRNLEQLSVAMCFVMKIHVRVGSFYYRTNIY
jgi:hypothetical protein